MRPIMGVMSTMINKAFLNKEVEVMAKYIDDGLQGKSYFMGTENPTKVDFAMFWCFDFAMVAAIDSLEKYPNVKVSHERCYARDAWKRALERGNGYDMNIEM